MKKIHKLIRSKQILQVRNGFANIENYIANPDDSYSKLELFAIATSHANTNTTEAVKQLLKAKDSKIVKAYWRFAGCSTIRDWSELSNGKKFIDQICDSWHYTDRMVAVRLMHPTARSTIMHQLFQHDFLSDDSPYSKYLEHAYMANFESLHELEVKIAKFIAKNQRTPLCDMIVASYSGVMLELKNFIHHVQTAKRNVDTVRKMSIITLVIKLRNIVKDFEQIQEHANDERFALEA